MVVLRMLYKIMCNPMDSIYGALPVPYVSVRVTRGALAEHRYRYRTIYIPLSVSLWNDLCHHVFDGVGLTGSKSRVIVFLLAKAACSFFFIYFSSFFT